MRKQKNNLKIFDFNNCKMVNLWYIIKLDQIIWCWAWIKEYYYIKISCNKKMRNIEKVHNQVFLIKRNYWLFALCAIYYIM